MVKKASPPATKNDLQQFVDHLTSLIGESEARTAKRIDVLQIDNCRWKEEIKLHFDTVAENMLSDFRGGLSDKISQHEDRIVRLEEHTGLRT